MNATPIRPRSSRWVVPGIWEAFDQICPSHKHWAKAWVAYPRSRAYSTPSWISPTAKTLWELRRLKTLSETAARLPRCRHTFAGSHATQRQVLGFPLLGSDDNPSDVPCRPVLVALKYRQKGHSARLHCGIGTKPHTALVRGPGRPEAAEPAAAKHPEAAQATIAQPLATSE